MSDNSPKFTVNENDNNFARFRWTIDISSIHYSGTLHDIRRGEHSNNTAVINSDKFSINPYDSVEWQISILIHSNTGTMSVGFDNYFYDIDLTVVLKSDKCGDKDLKATFCYNILDSDSVMYTKNPLLDYSAYKSKSEISQNHILSPVFSNNNLLFFKNNLMIIDGHITLQEDCCKIMDKAEFGNLRQLQQDWKIALKDKHLVDVSLEVDGSILQAHNLVLSSRSPVFRKMFETNMIESTENSVKVEDMGKEVMEAFILFLYTGEIEDHSLDTVAGLYYAADKYEVKSLQDTCRKLLASHLSVETALKILKLSDIHSDNCLKYITTNFLIENFQKIFITNEWKAFVDANTYLATYIMNCISIRMIKI